MSVCQWLRIGAREHLRRALAGTAVLACLGGMACAENATTTVEVDRVEITSASTSVPVGETLLLAAQVFGASGDLVSTTPIRWSSSNNAVASVTTSGVVTALTPGAVRIAASSMGRSDVLSLTIVPRPVAAIELTSQATVQVNRAVRLTAVTLDARGTVLIGRPVAWTSNNTSVATVGNDGTVTGVAPGVATITATSEGRTAQSTITVFAAPVQSVAVSPERDTLIVGGARTLTATLRDATGALLTGRTVVWSSSNVAVAIVSAGGVVSTLAPGIVTIGATSEGRTGVATIVVLERRASAVTIRPEAAQLIVGRTLALESQVTDASGNVLPGRPVTYVSETPSVASVSAAGVVTALAPGRTRILAASEGRTGSATIDVLPEPVATLQLSPETGTVVVGDSLRLLATARRQDGQLVTGRRIEWRSGAPTIAVVRSDGTVVGTAPGTAVILATAEGVVASATITVRLPTIGSVTLTPLAPTIAVGQSVQLAATVRDAEGRPLSGRTLLWSSNNEPVAFVSASGLVVGARLGTALITVTVDGVSASTLVSVR